MTCVLDPGAIEDVATVSRLETDLLDPTASSPQSVTHPTHRTHARRLVTGFTALILVTEMVFVAPRLGAM